MGNKDNGVDRSIRTNAIAPVAMPYHRFPDSAAVMTKFTIPFSIVVLVDEEVSHDKRVLATLGEYAEMDLCVVDCVEQACSSTLSKLTSCLGLAAMLPFVVATGFALWAHLKQRHALTAKGTFCGLRTSLRAFLKAKSTAERLNKQKREIRLIHAHDLFCGMIGVELSRLTGAKLIYDAHEIEFHRNRKNSWFRAAFDSFIERRIVDQADEVRVVNAPIAELYREIYDLPKDKVHIVHNNHFPASIQKGSQRSIKSRQISFVYVGEGIKGRQLEQLAEAASRCDVTVHAFFIGKIPQVAITGNWHLGPSNYQSDLDILVNDVRCVMWCCVDDVCLSYRLSLPNKFFQAMAVGIPIVAAVGTYLADIVKAYGVGYVFDGHNFDEIANTIRGTDFASKIDAVYRLRLAVAAGTARI